VAAILLPLPILPRFLFNFFLLSGARFRYPLVGPFIRLRRVLQFRCHGFVPSINGAIPGVPFIAMSDLPSSPDLGALRLRLSLMSDTALRAYGRSLVAQCRPEKRRTPPLSEFEILLTEIQVESRRRHPAKQKTSSFAKHLNRP
jgi:hypothetical protein